MKNLLNIDPVRGFAVSAASFIAGVSPEAAMAAEPVIRESVQCSLIFYFQITAFSVTIIAGLLSAYLSYKRITKK